MKLVLVSTFWNAGNNVKNCIESIKNQYYTNFVSYFIDDMSTDNSYDIAKKTIGDDDRFILIKNKEKKFKTKNFVDVIRNNPKIEWDDVIIEIDGDDKLSDNFVLGRINKVFQDNNIWLCGTKFKDNYGNLGTYSKPNPEKARSTTWNFSHMRSFRAFLFRSIKDEHLKMNDEYFKGACDIGHAIPMLEMSGSEHFYYIDEPLYTYNWHKNQSYSENGGIGDNITQSKTAAHIYSLPKYNILKILNDGTPLKEEPKNQLVINIVKNVNNQKPNHSKIIENISKESVKSEIPKKENLPKDRNKLQEKKKNGNFEQLLKITVVKPNRRNNHPNIFAGRKKF